jgi:uncharacterized protein (TIGR03083 family)
MMGGHDLVTLFTEERDALLQLLASLTDEEWQRPTVCPDWAVHDIALHLLNDDLRYLSSKRDGYRSPSLDYPQGPLDRQGVTSLVNQLNQRWLDGARWLSPSLVQTLLAMTGPAFTDYAASVDLNAIGGPINWIGPDPAPVGLDLAREYTERWVHQQHIRDATGRPGLMGNRHFYPVMDTFAKALPCALRDVPAPAGSIVQLLIHGDGGGSWCVVRSNEQWQQVDAMAPVPFALVMLQQDDAWRLFTKGISKEDAVQRGEVAGDRDAVNAVLQMVTVLA